MRDLRQAAVAAEHQCVVAITCAADQGITLLESRQAAIRASKMCIAVVTICTVLSPLTYACTCLLQTYTHQAAAWAWYCLRLLLPKQTHL
jgi:hypothetical protein